MKNIENDLYLTDIPSITKTVTKGFHAKNDAPEVREKINYLVDIYDLKKYPNNFYNKDNTFSIEK
ncbi:MAG: hypothetical protein M1371_10200 [Actinobacteria bacterium]|nr:hypothetical protein [Actinomycetota bacterium]